MSSLLRRVEDTRQLEAVECRIVLVGSASVGKTSIIRRYVDNEFLEESSASPTINLDVAERIEADWDPPMKLTIWDTVGQERFGVMSTSAIKRAHVLIVVYAIDDEQSFDTAREWLDKLSEERGGNTVTILVGNKLDRVAQGQERVDEQRASLLCETAGCSAHYRVSAKTNAVVRDIFSGIQRIYAQNPMYFAGKKGVITVSSQNNNNQRRGCMC